MARPPKGKPLTFRPLRLDDEVFAECQRLGKEYGTINEGLRMKLFEGTDEMQVKQGAFTPNRTGTVNHVGIPGPINEHGEREPHRVLLLHPDGKVQTEDGETYAPAEQSEDGSEIRYEKVAERPSQSAQTWKRGPRPKGDKTR